MNVVLPEEEKISKRKLAIFTIIIIICIIAIGVAVYQFFKDEKLGVILGITSNTNEQYEELKADFDNLFTNTCDEENNTVNPKKVEEEKNIVYTFYEKQDSSVNNYEINVQIPYINIDNDTIKAYNEEIQNNFMPIVENALKSTNKNVVYTVEYKACVTNNILSVMIRSNLKQANSAQRVIIQTYNFNLKENKEIKLTDLLDIKGISKEEASYRVTTEIKKAQEQAKDLSELGYNIYQRDYTSEFYKIENTTEFYTDGRYLYLIYPYGNASQTSEMDIVILE